MNTQRLIIYKITNLKTNKSYIGITSRKLEQRWKEHCKPNSFCKHLRYSINKYGKENFTIELVFTVLKKEDGIYFEDFFIDFYNTLHPNGYNLVYSQFKKGVSKITSSRLSIAAAQGWIKPDSRERLLKERKERWNEPERREKYSNIMKERVNNGDLKENYNKCIKPYIENKKEPIVGVNINNKEIIKFDNILIARKNNFNPGSCLYGNSIQTNGYCWFYNEGQEDDHFILLTEQKIGGFGNYRKSGKEWDDPIHKESRINSMIEAAKDRAKPLVAVSRFNGDILEFPSVNDAIKKGFTWGSVRQALIGECEHAYNYCWFYKQDNFDYVSTAKFILGKFNDTNIKPFIAINIETSEKLNFNKLVDIKSTEFDIKSVRQVLIGRRKSHKGYIWKFV